MNYRYDDFIKKFINSGYKFIKFADLNEPLGELILRHDVDASLLLAHKMATREYKINISSTYFIMVTNNLYNILTKDNFNLLKEMIDMGHFIGLHFDSSIYNEDELFDKLIIEVSILETLLNINIDSISFHQDIPKSLINIEKKFHIANSNRYSKDIKYFSDSNGIFGYGHPVESDEFASLKNIQLLIHPIWWMIPGKNNIEIIRTLYNDCKDHLKYNLKEACLSNRKGYKYDKIWGIKNEI